MEENKDMRKFFTKMRTLKAVEPGCQPGATYVWAWGSTAVSSARWKTVKKCLLARAGKAAFWCPTVMIILLFWETGATGSYLCPTLALAPWAQWAEGAGADANAGAWRRCSRRTWPPQPTGHGKLPRALLSIVIETVKGELLTYFSFISGIARLLKVIVKGVTLWPQKRSLFSPLSCLSPGRVSLSSHLVPLPTSRGSLSRSYLSRPHRGHCPVATICHWNVSSSESGLLKE